MGDRLSQWHVTELQWPLASNGNEEQFARLQKNIEYLKTVGAKVVARKVDATKGALEFQKVLQKDPNYAALVVWGSPCNDHPTDTHGNSLNPDPMQDTWRGSNVYKADKFKELVRAFPHASVIITCTSCSPPLLPEEDDRVLLRVTCNLLTFLNKDNTIASYEARYETGEIRMRYSASRITAMVACGKYVQRYLTYFFNDEGDFELYKFMAYSAFCNKTDGFDGETGPAIVFGEEAADLSRCAAHQTREQFVPLIEAHPERFTHPVASYADRALRVPYRSGASRPHGRKHSPRRTPKRSPLSLLRLSNAHS
jgi:hypothetical protein